MTTATTKASGTFRVHPGNESQMISSWLWIVLRRARSRQRRRSSRSSCRKSANHAAIDCYHLRRTFSNSGGGKKNKKPADKEPEDDDHNDQGRNPKFQDTLKVVNIIFGGMRILGLGGTRSCFSGRSCLSSRRYHDHFVGRRSPSRSPALTNG
jgi:hypothetical protein